MTEFTIQMALANLFYLLDVTAAITFFVIIAYLTYHFFSDGILKANIKIFYALVISVIILIFNPSKEQHFATMLEKDREFSFMSHEQREIVTSLFNKSVK